MLLVEQLIQQGWLKTRRIIEAFGAISRADFLPQDDKNLAEFNEALSIGYGQTISQPLVVVFMLELLQPKPGERILDVGSGSGWTSALLAQIVGNKGKVIALEIVPQLKEFGEKNASKYGFVKKGITQFVLADGSKGYEREAPYDKILCSAAVGEGEIPAAWKNQLKTGGRLVAPLGNSIWLFVKKSAIQFETQEYPGFVFVPLVVK